jgi:hypothetical protein
LQYENSALVAVKRFGKLGGDIQAGGGLSVQDDFIARERRVVTDEFKDTSVHLYQMIVVHRWWIYVHIRYSGVYISGNTGKSV